MVSLTRAEKLRKEENARSYKPLIDDLTGCSETEFLSKLQQIVEWDRSRDDLYVWIPVLNRIDEILTRIVQKYHYNSTEWKKHAYKLELMNKEDEHNVHEYLAFSTRLLNNTMNRFIYNSLDVMNSLLNCPNFVIKMSAARLIATMAERISHSSLDNNAVLTSDELKQKALKLALCLPSSTTDDNSDHFALIDLFLDKKKTPSKFSVLEYKYFAKNTKRNVKDTSKSPVKLNQSYSSKMRTLKLTSAELSSLTLQQVFDRGMTELPKEEWFTFSLRATVAKAFSDNTFENVQLRNHIIQTKFNAIVIINAILYPPQVSSQFFEVDPYAFNSLSDFISPSEAKVPRDIRMDALFALECISLKHLWCSDIVRNIGGNMSHGLLFQILKHIANSIKDNTSYVVDEEFNVRFFYLISNLVDVRVLQESLLNAGLISSILDILSVENSNFRRTKASATHLLEVLTSNDSIDDFINNDGMKILIDSLNSEVSLAIEHPELGKPPQYSTVYYSISFRQISFIRSLLKLVLKLLSCDAGNRTRNLIDSPILGALNTILMNKAVFGYTLLSHVLDIVQTVINVEPTIYQVLVESETVPFIIDNFQKFVCPSSELLKILPEVISALCLQSEGLKQVREKKLISFIFEIPTNLELAKVMCTGEEYILLGSSIDELARHYPELKEDVVDEFAKVVLRIPEILNLDHPHLYKSTINDGNFYLSADEDVIENEDGASEIDIWEIQDYSVILEAFSGMFFGMMENVSWVSSLSKRIKPDDLFSALIPRRPTHDFIDSQCFLNFTDALKTFDDEDSKYALPTLLKILKNSIEELSEFINYDQEKSFMLDMDDQIVEETLRKINVLQVVLSIITSVYIDLFSLFPQRVLQLISYFRENGFDLIDLLRITFERCALEEYFIRTRLPVDISDKTRPTTSEGTPSLLLYKMKPQKDVKSNGTSSKFKNTLLSRFLFHTTQSCISILFRSFLRMSHARKISLEPADLSGELRLFNEVSRSFVNMLSNYTLEGKLGYLVVLLNLASFSFSYMTSSSKSHTSFNTIPILLFYQQGGFETYRKWCLILVEKCFGLSDVSPIEAVDYLKDDHDVLVSHGLVATFSFLNKSIQLQTMEMIRSTKDYYPSDEITYNMTSGLLVTLRILALGLVKEIFDQNELFNDDRRMLPYPVFKQLLNLVKNIYSSSDEIQDSDFSLYELRWDLIPPSQCKIEMLKSCGISEDIAMSYLVENKDDLPVLVKPDEFSDSEWQNYLTAKASGTWETNLQLLPPAYDNFTTRGDLCDFRTRFYRNGFEQKVLRIVKNYPKLINAVSKMFLEIYDELEFPHISMLEDLLTIMNATQLQEADKLAPIVHLFGIFLNEEKIYNQSKTVIHKFITFLLQNLSPQYVNQPWFFKALYVYEIILARSMFPDYVELPESYKVPEIPTSDVQHLSTNDKDVIFDVLIRVADISDFYSALAISRILILYAADMKYASEIIQSGIVPKLLKVIGTHQKSEKINYLESSLLLLCRRCFETKEVVTSLIKYELNRAFTTRAIGDSKEKTRDLTLLISEKANVIMRDPEVFVSELCKTGRFVDFSTRTELGSFLMKRFSTEEDQDMEQEKTSQSNSFNRRTGIVDLLLSQLMAAFRKDWVSEPPAAKEEEKKKSKKDRKKPEVLPSKNPICAYMIFLLKVLLELLSSYNQCKYEFMTFNKRGIYSECPSPRSTALNFFIHQLLDNKLEENDAFPAKCREVVGKLANCVLTAFISSVQNEKVEKPDPKSANPDLTFIRKLTLDSIMKAMKDLKSNKSSQVSVMKFYGWFNLVHKLLITDNLAAGFMDNKRLHSDKYEICKLMIELNVPETITDCLSTLDLNSPTSTKLYNAAVDTLNSITEIRNDFSELFKAENNDEEDDVEEESDKEDVPDMFRNSALGMYDIEDIEDDDDDDDSLIGDEGIAFVENDDGIEIVFSGDEDSQDSVSETETGSSDTSSSHDEASSDEDMDDIEAHSGSESISTGVDDGDSDDNSYYSDGSPIVVEINESGDGSDLEIDLDDSELSSDWESGLSELDDTDYNSDEANEEEEAYYASHNAGRNNNRWYTSDGVEIFDDSDGEGRGIYRGIQHVPDEDTIFRIDTRSMINNRRRQNSRATITPSIFSLGTEPNRTRSTLMNPLGPLGMEEVEDTVSSNPLENSNPRGYGSGVTHIWLADSLLDNKSTDGIVVENTTDRWGDIFEMFYEKKGFLGNVLPQIVSRVIARSAEMWLERQKEASSKQSEDTKTMDRARKRNVDEMAMDDNEAENMFSRDVSDVAEEQEDETTTPPVQHEPVYVIIDGNEVDIGGTDIDPEFINALPEEMRSEVLAQHISERRAEAQQQQISSREINDDFLDSVPENIREEIMAGETLTRRFSNLFSNDRPELGNESGSVSDYEMNSDINGGAANAGTKSKRVHFEPLVDRSGVASIIKSLFIPQPYFSREAYHELFYKLCSSKQNCSDIMNFLLLILTEGITDQHSFEKVFNLISNKANTCADAKYATYQLPPDCTPLIVANQTIEVLQFLIDSDSRLRFFFVTEHDNLIINKPQLKSKKDIFSKNMKWPINALFSLLNQRLVTDETVLMESLTNILKLCSKPISTLVKKQSENSSTKRSFQVPVIERRHLELIISIIKLDSCNTKIFQQTLNTMTNLFHIEDTQEIFTSELRSLAMTTITKLIQDLDELYDQINLRTDASEIDTEVIQKFTSASSEQSKLLKVVTAVDFIYSHQKQDDAESTRKLVALFNEMRLGPVWVALSKCLAAFEAKSSVSTSATVLLPTIESLMVVCKNSKVRETTVGQLKYTEKSYDFETIPVEDLFFEFTDLHKKLLNEMIRSSPQLMSGPFQLLVKNPKILDFDNKRYFFMAKLRQSRTTRQKLSITVRRDQVFLDSYRSLFFKSNDEIKTCKLDITFKGEAGVDEGGVTREWYQVLSRQMFNPDYALFIPVGADNTKFRPNRTSGINPEHLSFFKFVGMIIGKAISDNCFLDCHFSREVYKNILGIPVSLKDMESIDPEYYKSLNWILENDITDIIEETFSVDTDDYGEHKTIDLIPNGQNIPVTEKNKKEYVQKVVEYKLRESVKDHMENLLQGFYTVIDKDLISIFDEQELELLISGLPDIDVDDWKNNTTYVNYTATSKQINYFWRAVRSFDKEERAKLLQFVTGTSKLPLNGFKDLGGMSGNSKFSIHRDYGSTDRLPSSHTCFNQLDLPAYDSYEQLRGSLLLAINEGHEGFGLA